MKILSWNYRGLEIFYPNDQLLLYISILNLEEFILENLKTIKINFEF